MALLADPFGTRTLPYEVVKKTVTPIYTGRPPYFIRRDMRHLPDPKPMFESKLSGASDASSTAPLTLSEIEGGTPFTFVDRDPKDKTFIKVMGGGYFDPRNGRVFSAQAMPGSSPVVAYRGEFVAGVRYRTKQQYVNR